MASVLCGNHSNHVVKINWITRENPAKVDRSNYWFNSVGVKVIGYISIRKYVVKPAMKLSLWSNISNKTKHLLWLGSSQTFTSSRAIFVGIPEIKLYGTGELFADWWSISPVCIGSLNHLELSIVWESIRVFDKEPCGTPFNEMW